MKMEQSSVNILAFARVFLQVKYAVADVPNCYIIPMGSAYADAAVLHMLF